MTYLNALEGELKTAGIPRRRRLRILAEFADHLDQNPRAELGTPHDLAVQFGDELGTRLARGTAFRAFGALALAAAVLVWAFFHGGRTYGAWVGYGSHPTSFYLSWWWAPLMVLWFISAQVALAARTLALLRAWQLRSTAVITTADAAVLNRRVALGLVAGVITMTIVPITQIVVGGSFDYTWPLPAIPVGLVLIALLLSMLPDVLRASRMRPAREGPAGDLASDLGTRDPRVTPTRIASALSVTITAVMVAIGIVSRNPGDGILRGVLDSMACMFAFAILGQYLGLRRSENLPTQTAVTEPQ